MELPSVQAQNNQKIQIRNAKKLIGSEKGGVKFRKLIGEVVLSQGNVLMYCDSAYDYTTQNYFQAFGHVRLMQGDSVIITGNRLRYDQKNKTAIIEQNVTMSDKKMLLKTARLFYDMNTGTASFIDGAKITESNSTLTSKTGFYYSQTRELHFNDKVLMENKDFTMNCDSLIYNIANHHAIFICPTVIKSEKQTIYTQGGWYNTTDGTSQFNKHTRIVTDTRAIRGDTLFYDDKKGYGLAIGNFELKDVKEKMTIRGNYAEYFDRQGRSYVTGRAMFIQFLENDTLYLHSDTIRMVKTPDSENTVIRAYHHVKAYSNDLQIKCDSMVYRTYDSSIYLYYDPVIWSKDNQITGLNVRITLKGKKVDKMFIDDNAMLVSKNDSIRFNQVKGRKMVGYFTNSQLSSIDVKGNAEAIYFLKDETGKFVGTNHIEASSIMIGVNKNKIGKIIFHTAPTGNVQPPAITSLNDIRLKGFLWRKHERPATVEDIFLHP
jgi:lipopolysaccharide export system protein LptA